MSALKTLPTNASVTDFINNVSDETKRKDSLVLLELFEKITGEKAKMWGTAIIGFGLFHYKSEKSRQEGDWFYVGFSPRKQNLTLYVLVYKSAVLDEILKKLGKYKAGGGCLYINKLADIDLKVLETLIKKSYEIKKKHHSNS